MYTDNRYLFIGYKILFILLCLWGLYLNSGLPQGAVRWGVLNYYTILSNIVCLVYFACALWDNFHRLHQGLGVRTYAPRMQGAVMFCIVVTMLIYNFVLAPTLFSMGQGYKVHSLANLLVHYIVPTMVVLDWALFTRKGLFRWYDPLLWLIIPYLYFLYSIVRAQVAGTPITGTSSRYAYDFIDIDKHGFPAVLENVGKLTLLFLALAWLIVATDHLLGRVQKRIKRQRHKEATYR